MSDYDNIPYSEMLEIAAQELEADTAKAESAREWFCTMGHEIFNVRWPARSREDDLEQMYAARSAAIAALAIGTAAGGSNADKVTTISRNAFMALVAEYIHGKQRRWRRRAIKEAIAEREESGE